MAIRVKQKIRKLQAIKNGLIAESVRIGAKYEKDIIRLNTDQFENGIGSDGRGLVNSNTIFKGRYSLYTQLVAKNTIAPKVAGDLYNFAWTGNFLIGMYVDFKNNGTYSIFSNGMGTGGKLAFFKGYSTLFGLTDKNEKIIRDKIKVDLKKYLKSRL